MNNTETELDEETTEKKPRRPRKRNAERDVVYYLIEGDNSKKLGQFPESVVGTPLERRIPIFAQEMFGKIFYGIAQIKADIRKANGAFEKTMNFSIATEPERKETGRQNIVEDEPEDFEDESEEYEFQSNAGQMKTVEVENLLLKERLKRIEDDLHRQKSGNQSEMQTLISALEESRREQRELMMMMLSQSQKPQQDATTQAMGILEKSLGIVTRAKAISEEIAPQETESSVSFLGDAAKLVDSLGRNAGQFIPMFFNKQGNGLTGKTRMPPKATQPRTNNGNQQGELNGLLANIKNKKEGNKNG